MDDCTPLFFEAENDTRTEVHQNFNVSNRSLKRAKREKAKQQSSQENTEKLRRRHPLPLTAKTQKQAEYLDALYSSDQIFAVGGAGTGKTYIPSRMAVQAVVDSNYSRVIITRPTVSRKEHKLGFLPGSAKQKMDPWLIPIIASMKEQVNPALITTMMNNEQIEFVPFEHMRGRTFKDAFVILDEAQNCTLADLRLFLTRIGEDSKVIVTGDSDQVDIEDSGLEKVISMIEKHGVNASVIRFGPNDVVRSKIAREWVTAFAAEQSK